MDNQIQNARTNEVGEYGGMPANGPAAKNMEFKGKEPVIVDGKPKKTVAEKQLLVSRIIAILIALIVVLLLVVVLIALPKTMKLIDKADKTVEQIDSTIEEATGVIEDIEVAVNDAADVIESIDIDGVNQSIESLNTVSSSIANIFSIFK